MKASQLLFFALFAAAHLVAVHSHTYISSLNIDGKAYAEGECLKPYRSWEKENPIASVTSPDMTCGFLPSSSGSADHKCPVNPGSKISMQWHHNSNSASDDIIADSHQGPCMVYMAKSDTGAGNVWFKIWEEGYNPATSKWCVDNLRANKGVFSFTVPSDISPGNYLLRGEIIALHEGHALGGAQPYVLCAEVTVSGSGTANPAGVAIPGAYSPTDPGIYFNIYSGFSSYVIPGPAVYTPSSTPATTAPTTKPATTVPTTKPATPAPTIKAATPAPTTKAATPTPTTKATPAPPSQGATSAPGSSIKVSLHSSSSVWWAALKIDAGSAGTSRVEFQDAGMTTFAECAETNYGYWEFHPSAAIVVPVTLRVTSSTGARVVLTNIIKDLTVFSAIDSGITFGSSPPPGTAAPATQAPSTPAPATTSPATQAPTFPPTVPPSGNAETVHMSLHSGSSIWWLAVAVSNADPTKVEFKDSGSLSSWTAMVANPSWGYYTFGTQGSSITLPITVRATSSSGKTASVTFSAMGTTTPVDSGVSF